MFGIAQDEILTAASGAQVYSAGFENEERDSALAIEDYYFVGGGQAGYIMRSPSGRKYSVKVGQNPFVDVSTHIDAEKALLSQV